MTLSLSLSLKCCSNCFCNARFDFSLYIFHCIFAFLRFCGFAFCGLSYIFFSVTFCCCCCCFSFLVVRVQLQSGSLAAILSEFELRFHSVSWQLPVVSQLHFVLLFPFPCCLLARFVLNISWLIIGQSLRNCAQSRTRKPNSLGNCSTVQLFQRFNGSTAKL